MIFCCLLIGKWSLGGPTDQPKLENSNWIFLFFKAFPETIIIFLHLLSSKMRSQGINWQLIKTGRNSNSVLTKTFPLSNEALEITVIGFATVHNTRIKSMKHIGSCHCHSPTPKRINLRNSSFENINKNVTHWFKKYIFTSSLTTCCLYHHQQIMLTNHLP